MVSLRSRVARESAMCMFKLTFAKHQMLFDATEYDGGAGNADVRIAGDSGVPLL